MPPAADIDKKVPFIEYQMVPRLCLRQYSSNGKTKFRPRGSGTLPRNGAEANMEYHNNNLEQGKTALMFAAQQRHQVRLGKLLDYEAQINNTTYYGATA
jgi:hypothetical protein